MTKEEVAGIVAYCTENNISQKQRLAELGISGDLTGRELRDIIEASSGRV